MDSGGRNLIVDTSRYSTSSLRLAYATGLLRSEFKEAHIDLKTATLVDESYI
jgi:hypothetical protein